MEEIKFSIIVPCYNVEKYIESTLITIKEQTYSNFEVILINDGSKDNTLKVLEKFSIEDKRFKIYSQKNKGVSEARNKGIELVSGDYIGFLDGDDQISVDLLEKAYKVFKKENVEMFSYGYILFGNKKKSYNNKRFNNQKMNSKEFLKNLLTMDLKQHICSFITKKEILEKVKFNRELIMGEDIDFQMRVLMEKDFKIFISREELFYYIKRENSATTTKIFDMKEFKELEYLKKLAEKIEKEYLLEFEYYQIIRFFGFIKKLADRNLSTKEYKKIKNELKSYEFILNKLKIEFNKKSLFLNILKWSYVLNLKIVICIFKIINKLSLNFK